MQSKIGVIGLGAMGKPMAANITKVGFELTVYDLREAPCKELAARGARVPHRSGKSRKRAISCLTEEPPVV